ncbi:hypothetical protein FRB99_005159 [Tulasnella sp. 403]|nr:hypothetical protein FRB99_005159 [Tulasnella sp. 403]
MAPQAATSQANTTSVQVAVRIRPPNSHDSIHIPTRFQRTVVHGSSPTTVAVDPCTIPQSTPAGTSAAAANPLAKKQSFAFDQVHPQDTTQHSIYTATAAPLVARFLQGFNCTVLAYGQTSSGKTYTMTGVDLDSDPGDSTNGMGIVPRAVASIFASIQQIKQERGNAWNCSVKGSFIEIYNEDLIDLLAPEDPSFRREVQIREEKDGTIIWSGLREVNVKSTNEVMNLLRAGSSIRRTNETDMNAQSSRSHAIFSLTLTQKKYTGSGIPKTSSGRTSPMPPTGPSTSRLARPSSVYVGGANRVGSPTFGRPPTPSFASAMRGAGLRPASAMALRPGSPDHEESSDSGAWVTVTSKFHFVDLAGSERLKRTAAVGDRIKEGISINSGLLALGNVISALGDPSRARSLAPNASGHIHVPYRDSKLTRLLQDSLGGNSHTLMIACVSPAEWNAAETVNTLKYANRARNIKNRAEVREKEEGWDDLEWLQGMIIKLRKEVKALKEGGAVVNGTSGDENASTGATKMLQQYHELQVMHEELRSRYATASDELRKTKQELEDRPLMSPGGTTTERGANSIRRYEEIVAPVIEQYEKTISAMEAELKLNRTALAHTNEMYEEQEQELEALKERHSTTEAYVEELRARVGKLVERESTTETYVRDLEQKLKAYSESSASSSESLNDLRKELAHYKEAETSTTTYIAELEARLSRSDSDLSSVRGMVERLEEELEKKSAQVGRLEAKLDVVLNSEELQQQRLKAEADMEQWKADLEERERKVAELEKQMEEWQKVRLAAGSERKRLGGIVEDQQRLLEQAFTSSSSSSNASPAITGSPMPVLPESALEHMDHSGLRSALQITTGVSGTSTPSHVPLPTSPTDSISSSTPPDVVREQLISLRETHSKTLEDLSTVTSKYRDSLREISDLAGQISEIKIQLSQQPPLPTPSPLAQSHSGDLSDADSATTMSRTPRTPLTGSPGPMNGAHRRRRTVGRGDTLPPLAISSPTNQAKKLFFRHASSAESLHNRSQSQTLSQELSMARMPRDPWTVGESLLSPTLPKSPMRMSLQLPGEKKRSVESLEKEIMRLQEVLKEREEEISVLEKSLDTFERSRSSRANTPSRKASPDVLKEEDEPAEGAEDQATPIAVEKEKRESSSTGRGNIDPTFDSDVGVPPEGDDSLTRLNELMRSMAQKESQHKEAVEQMNQQLQTIRRQHDDLLVSSKELNQRMATEMDAMRNELSTAKDQTAAVEKQLEELRQREKDLLEERRVVQEKHTAEIAALQAEHDAELSRSRQEHSDLITRISEEHEDAVQYAMAKARREAEVAAVSQMDASLAQLAAEHELAMSKLSQQHETDLRKHEIEVETLLARTRADHERVVTRIRGEHEEAIRARDAETSSVTNAKKAADDLAAQYAATVKRMEDAHQQELLQAASESQAHLNRIAQEHEAETKALGAKHDELVRAKQEETTASLRKLQDEHDATLARVRAEHADALTRKAAEFDVLVQRMRDEHAAEMRQAEITREGSMSESQAETAQAMKQLQEAHAEALERRDASTREDLENLKAEHERMLSSRDADHKAALERLNTDHAAALSALETTSSLEVKRLQEELASAEKSRQETVADLQSQLSRAQEEFTSLRNRLAAEHELDILALKATHDEDMSDIKDRLRAMEESHRTALEARETEQESSLVTEKERHSAAIAELEQAHAAECESLRKVHSTVSDELDTQRQLLSQANVERAQERMLHQTDVDDLKTRLATMEEHLQSVMTERASYAATVDELRAELEATRAQQTSLVQEASKRQSLVEELERHRSLIGDMQSDLQRVKDEKDNLVAEKSRQEALMRDLQAQVTVKGAHKRDGSGDSAPSHAAVSRISRPNGIPPAKLPPLTPPPSVPPPPLPPTNGSVDLSNGTATRTSTPSQPSRAATPDEQPTPSTSVMMSPSLSIDPKIAALIEEQAKHLEEQETMIKTLNKQLTHCEADLQAHMDLVATLEASLTDSERNLRKARLQSNELAKERDSYQQQMAGLRMQVAEAQREASNMRRSVAEEKLTLEHRLEEERKAKERARAQLDSRMEEMAKRKSKFVCL